MCFVWLPPKRLNVFLVFSWSVQVTSRCLFVAPWRVTENTHPPQLHTTSLVVLVFTCARFHNKCFYIKKQNFIGKIIYFVNVIMRLHWLSHVIIKKHIYKNNIYIYFLKYFFCTFFKKIQPDIFVLFANVGMLYHVNNSLELCLATKHVFRDATNSRLSEN